MPSALICKLSTIDCRPLLRLGDQEHYFRYLENTRLDIRVHAQLTDCVVPPNEGSFTSLLRTIFFLVRGRAQFEIDEVIPFIRFHKYSWGLSTGCTPVRVT